MGIRSLIFPTCKELAERLSSGAYEKSAWPVRLAVRWHLARCELCRLYERQVKLLGDALRHAHTTESAPAGLKARIIEKLQRDLDR